MRGSGTRVAAEAPWEAAAVSCCRVLVRPSRQHLSLPRGLVLTLLISIWRVRMGRTSSVA